MKRQSKSAATSSSANPKSTSLSQINTSVGAECYLQSRSLQSRRQ
ncbi:hypothetical protein RchiOBHm_Chr1g0370061 [Rosa chinensis]|uniref:Uncharacterized protein n=1 Tax=Rosa chinensis TaxID=74649 RepID=A0A2P6SL82_ROSCH|nr:hypothetical protein RchiOBHm_Chr1g0370061 [Rosa chinensis]